MSKTVLTSHLSYATIFRLFLQCKHGKSDFKDGGRSEKPSTAPSNANTEKLNLIFKDNPYITYQYIQQTLNMRYVSNFKLLHEDLIL